MTYTKKHNPSLWILIAFAMTALISIPAAAQEPHEEDIWAEGPQGRGPFELTPERAEWILERIAEQDPERAEHLRRLHEENPEAFKAELQELIRQFMRERMADRGRPEQRERQPRGGGGRRDRDKGPQPRGQFSRPGMGGGDRGRVKERYEEYVAWLETNYPEEAAELQRTHEHNPEAFAKRATLSMKRYGPILHAEKQNPELADVLKEDLELKAMRGELLEAIKTAQGDELNALQQQLQDVIAARFDLIVRRKQLQYEHLRKKLEELEKEIADREAEVDKLMGRKDQAVQDRIQELIGKTESIDWD